jgi:MFS family permease
MLAFGGLLLFGGRLGDVVGRRRVFGAGVTLFTLASLVGGAAPTDTVLSAARAAQSVGAAIAAPTALGILLATFAEGAPRNKALGLFSAHRPWHGQPRGFAPGHLQPPPLRSRRPTHLDRLHSQEPTF